MTFSDVRKLSILEICSELRELREDLIEVFKAETDIFSIDDDDMKENNERFLELVEELERRNS